MNVDQLLREYEASRYLRHAPDVALDQRLQNIGGNLWSTDRDGNVTPTRDQSHRQALLKLYNETLFEQHLRNPADLIFDEAQTRARFSHAYMPPKLKSPITFNPPCLAKFGKQSHIVQALETGRIRIAPASAYNDPSLNAAQQDEELQHHVRTPNERLKIRMFGRDMPDGEEREIFPEWLELFRYMNVPNFYVWCCGLGYDARLFKEFEADAALIVLDKDAFALRMRDAFEREKPGIRFEHKGIGYYDPYTTQHHQLVPAFSKNLKYLYQNEYRFVWWMPAGATLDPFFIELGTLRDIATIVELA